MMIVNNGEMIGYYFMMMVNGELYDFSGNEMIFDFVSVCIGKMLRVDGRIVDGLFLGIVVVINGVVICCV